MSEVMVVPMAKSRMSNNPPVKRRGNGAKKGKGFFSDLAKAGAKALLPKALDAGSEFLKRKVSGGATPYVSAPYMDAMSRHSEGAGFFDVVKSVGKAVAPSLIDAGKSYAEKKIKEKFGLGMFPVKLSPAQVRSVKKGGAIQIKPEMMGDMGQYMLKLLPQSAKKLMSALGKSKGLRLMLKEGEDVVDKMTGGSIFGVLGRLASSLLGGDGVLPAGSQRGRGAKKGKGFFGDLKKGLVSVGKAVAPSLIDAGKSYAEKKIKEKFGLGVYPAGGMVMTDEAKPIQLGSPYQSMSSPAMNPFVGTTGLSGYAPISGSRRGGAMMMAGVRPLMGSNPATYSPFGRSP
jgi:hypothetical protein